MSNQRVASAESIRSRAKQSVEHTKQQIQAEANAQRMRLVHTASDWLQQRAWPSAVAAFFRYIQLLENQKGVPSGGLLPKHFDPKTEAHELLLLSGVYWDLARIHDRVRKDNRDLAHFLEKFVLFSKGMRYQAVASETLRKYVLSGKAKHTTDFRNAYRVLSGQNLSCFVATALEDLTLPLTSDRLRYFRDEFLQHCSCGRAFIHYYYRHGPAWAETVKRAPGWFRRGLARLLDLFAKASELLTDCVRAVRDR